MVSKATSYREADCELDDLIRFPILSLYAAVIRRMDDYAWLAAKMADEPRWVEARSSLFRGDCQVFGFQDEPQLAAVVSDRITKEVFVVGHPEDAAVKAAVSALRRPVALITPFENSDWLDGVLDGWTCSRAILHVLEDREFLPRDYVTLTGFLDADSLGELNVPMELRQELMTAGRFSPIAATFVDNRPVSFCYAGAITETLWDIAIDTLAPYRRRGFAGLCVARMIDHMQSLGKQPVWGSEVANVPSWRLARKLGFTPVDELALFEPSV